MDWIWNPTLMFIGALYMMFDLYALLRCQCGSLVTHI